MYDSIIIGAGMSGLAAGIRLAMFGQSVCILERHYAIGGLNSYYRLNDRNYDVGLHAVTNYAARDAKQGPLPRLLRQLRLKWDDFALAQQQGSVIVFPDVQLRFHNDPALLKAEIARAFPTQLDHYERLLGEILDYDELMAPRAAASTREILSSIISEPLLVEMLLCPVMFYGNAREHDMEFGQFSVLFRAIFLEGLGRPLGGIRVILKQLVRRYKELGGQLRLRSGVKQIASDNQQAIGVILDDGTQLDAKQILSSAGWNETMRLCNLPADRMPRQTPGELSFVETICSLDCQPTQLGFNETIVFYNDSERFHYANPEDFVDLRSGIICTPNNFCYRDAQLPEGWLRLTALANYQAWSALRPDEYQAQKAEWYEKTLVAAAKFIPDLRNHMIAHDTFTPTTIVRYTGHDRGAVYGAPQKRYDAKTPLEGLLVCGADQGFVGIVGTLTSGIQVANLVLRAT
ncbi:MAG: NAD(P)/FAD-dependent oxidoreductase [Pirellulales bacterium]|nr:NAD(P)/FAD-dependent oxidoreductase [Pirellulales bacterium]